MSARTAHSLCNRTAPKGRSSIADDIAMETEVTVSFLLRGSLPVPSVRLCTRRMTATQCQAESSYWTPRSPRQVEELEEGVIGTFHQDAAPTTGCCCFMYLPRGKILTTVFFQTYIHIVTKINEIMNYNKLEIRRTMVAFFL